MLSHVSDLLTRFNNRDERALARGISLLEAGVAAGQALLRGVRAKAGRAHLIGVTGSPGSGKSTLVDALIGVARARGERVAVVAVDPTSPFSGGAILGDRIRMLRWHQDADVYIRSMSTRGHLGGLAAATLQIITLLDAYGFDTIFIETVGVGQSEVDIVKVADSTLLILTPGAGDGVQAFKSGVMEIADVFAINKFDLPGATRLKREIKAALELGHPSDPDWFPSIADTIASKAEGVEELFEQLRAHHTYLKTSGRLESKRTLRQNSEAFAQLTRALATALENADEDLLENLQNGSLSPTEVLKRLVSRGL